MQKTFYSSSATAPTADKTGFSVLKKNDSFASLTDKRLEGERPAGGAAGSMLSLLGSSAAARDERSLPMRLPPAQPRSTQSSAPEDGSAMSCYPHKFNLSLVCASCNLDLQTIVETGITCPGAKMFSDVEVLAGSTDNKKAT